MNDPHAVKQADNAVIVDNLLIEANKLEFEKTVMKKESKGIEVGQLMVAGRTLKSVKIHQCMNEIVGY